MHTVVPRFAARGLTRFFSACLAAAVALPAPARALTEAQQDAAIQQLQSAVASLQSTVNSQASQISALQAKASNQYNLIVALQKKTAALTVTSDTTRTDGLKNTELTLTGVNLHVVNGLGATNGEPTAPYDADNPVVNGLGNVIIGYDVTRVHDPKDPAADLHTGSHNLIVGDENNFSEYGGLLVGRYNTTSAPFASISGGYFNTASEDYASITGGYRNNATDYYATVLGGYSNTASGYASCISGGGGNVASNSVSSVSGGVLNTASGGNSSVSGGYNLLESSTSGWAAGGAYTGSSGPGVFHSP